MIAFGEKMKKTEIAAAITIVPLSTFALASDEVLYLSNDSWVAPAGGGTSNPVPVTNVGGGNPIAYAISEAAEWISLSSTNGTTPGVFDIAAAANAAGAARCPGRGDQRQDRKSQTHGLWISQPRSLPHGHLLSLRRPGSFPETAGSGNSLF